VGGGGEVSCSVVAWCGCWFVIEGNSKGDVHIRRCVCDWKSRMLRANINRKGREADGK
jgi:hypothetical protein